MQKVSPYLPSAEQIYGNFLSNKIVSWLRSKVLHSCFKFVCSMQNYPEDDRVWQWLGRNRAAKRLKLVN